MIVSKANLQCSLITKHDKIPVLNNVVIEEDGSTIGSNGKALMIVSPVNDKMKKSFPLKTIAPKERIIFSDETAKEVLKNLPRDTKFGGLLEHVIVETSTMNDEQAIFKVTDGKRTKELSGKKWDRKYINYQEMIQSASKSKKTVKVAVNLRRLMSLLDAIDKACPDTTGSNPVFLEFSDENDIILRAVNGATGQRALCLMKSYKGNEGTWLEQNEWERKLVYGQIDDNPRIDLDGNHVHNHSGDNDNLSLRVRRGSGKIPKRIAN